MCLISFPNPRRLWTLLLLGLLSGCAEPELPRVSNPNILLITIDTLRADRLGSYGYLQATTPGLDLLAGEGIRFERAYSPIPLTLPAHSTIFTGSYPFEHGVRDNSGYRLNEERQTLAELLQAKGYQTGAFVGAFVLDGKFGLDQGFDTYFDDFDLTQFAEVSPGYVQRPADEVVDESLRWLEGRSRENPFFAWVHLYDPHDPYAPPEPYLSRHPGRPYDGEIEFTDASIERLFEWLRAQGLYEEALIVVAGDHGESLGEHGEEKHGLFLYEGALRVPLIIRLPRAEFAGSVVSRPVSLVDIFPTVSQLVELEAGGLSPHGTDLSQHWLGQDPEPKDLYAETFYPFQHFGWSPLRALISERYKFIQAPRPELYDLQQDAAEQQNLAEERDRLAAGMRDQLGAMAGPLSAGNTDSPETTTDADTLNRLRALGYISMSPSTPDAGDLSDLLDPKDQIELYNQIVSLFELSQRDQHLETISGYQAILEQQPQLKIVRYKLGQAYFHTGRVQEAAEQFKRVIEQGGDEALAVFDLAQCYLRLGRAEEAASGFERTIELDPSHYRARTNLGIIYKNQGKISEAIEQLEKALAVAPKSVPALNTLGATYSLAGDHEKAVNTLSQAVKLAPQNAILHANLGMAYRAMGREDLAREALQKARELNPNLFR